MSKKKRNPYFTCTYLFIIGCFFSFLRKHWRVTEQIDTITSLVPVHTNGHDTETGQRALWIQDQDHRCTDCGQVVNNERVWVSHFSRTLNCTHRLLHIASDRQRLLLTNQSNEPVRLVHGAKFNTPSWIVIPSGCLEYVELIVSFKQSIYRNGSVSSPVIKQSSAQLSTENIHTMACCIKIPLKQ